MSDQKLLNVFQNKPIKSPPIWIMRQAGRYLPEYLEVRKNTGSFLDLCYNPEKAAEVTLQPLKRFKLDAAIIFSDILIIPHSMGLNVSFEKDMGPRVETINNESDLYKLTIDSSNEKLLRVYEALSLVKMTLDQEKTLIGFVGAPWTIATYIIEGKGKHAFEKSKSIAYLEPKFLEKLINKITEQTISHILGQIKAGAEVIQIFDSWAGVLGEVDYRKFVIKPTKQIIKEIKKIYPEVPIIGFPKGAGIMYEEYIAGTGVDGIGCDHTVTLKQMAEFAKNIVVQGNLDPIVLLSHQTVIKERAELILETMAGKRFIFNLGHGILPETKIENVEFLVDYVKSYKK